MAASVSTKEIAEKEFKDNYLTGILSKSSAYSGTNSFNDFEKIFKAKAKADYYYADNISQVRNFSIHRDTAYYETLTKDDYRKAFNKYSESRGCYSEKELQILNQAGYATMADFEEATLKVVKDILRELVEIGYEEYDFSEKESKEIVSVMNYSGPRKKN